MKKSFLKAISTKKEIADSVISAKENAIYKRIHFCISERHDDKRLARARFLAYRPEIPTLPDEAYIKIGKNTLEFVRCFNQRKAALGAMRLSFAIWKSDHGFFDWIEKDTTEWKEMISDLSPVIDGMRELFKIENNAKRRMMYAASQRLEKIPL